MRICIVTVAAHGIGGMQDHTRALAKGLVEAGHDVEVISTRHPEGLALEEQHGARWHYVDAAHHHPRFPRRDPAWLLRSGETFLRLHDAGPFDVIHSESTSAIGLVRRGIHRRVPLAAKYHGNAIALGKAALQRASAGNVHTKLREAKGLVHLFGQSFQYGQWYRFRKCVWMVPSHHEFEDTRRCVLAERSLGHVVPNGIDPVLFRPRPRDALRAELGLADGPIVVSVGRLNVQKGFHTAIRALQPLESSAQLVIVGDGEEREPLAKLARSLGLDGRVIFAGKQSHEGVANYLAAADVFVFPTERAEAAPLVLPQAMACALPVVASEIGGIPEVLERSGETGILVRPGDVAALVSALETLLRDEGVRLRLGEEARQRVLDEYTVERMVERTLDVYRFTIARHSRA